MSVVEFITSDVKFYTVSHLNDEHSYENNEFLLGVINTSNTIQIFKFQQGIKKEEFIIDVYSILSRKLKDNFTNINIDKLDLIYIKSDSNLFTLFIPFSLYNKQYVYQINCDGEQIVESKPIIPLYETNKLYLGYSDTKNVKYVDNKESVLHIKGLMYIDTDNTTNVSGKYIRRIPVYTTEDEQQELISKNLITSTSMYPIVDVWTNQYPVVLRLPESVEDHKFDFSSGLGILKLSD